MYKYLIALAILSGSFAGYADMYSDSYSESYKDEKVDDSTRSSQVRDTYSGENYYEDEASTRAAATARDETVNYPSASGAATTTGTMPDFSREGLIAQKWHAGVMTGISSPKGDQDTSPNFGIDVGYQPAENFGAGLEVFTAEQDDAAENQRTTGLFKGTFHLGGDIPVLNTAYLGAGAGPIFLDNKVNWGLAPMAGFDVPLSSAQNDFLSLGLNARYVFTSDEAETPNEFISAIALKYWF